MLIHENSVKKNVDVAKLICLITYSLVFSTKSESSGMVFPNRFRNNSVSVVWLSLKPNKIVGQKQWLRIHSFQLYKSYLYPILVSFTIIQLVNLSMKVMLLEKPTNSEKEILSL